MTESIGKRIASLRKQLGLTQEALAERIAISRVAITHIEMDISIPSERTITLIAGVLKLSPPDLIKGTSYPQSKADRLPWDACCYTKFEMEIEVLNNDLDWLGRIEDLGCASDELMQLKKDVRGKWIPRISAWESEYYYDLAQILAVRTNFNQITSN